MFALYSKAFAKSAVDLNKKEFRDGKDASGVGKLTAKASSGGVDYEVNLKNVADDADFKVTIPVDEKFKASIKTTAKGDTELEFEVGLADGMKCTLTSSNPTLDKKCPNTNVKVEYLDPAFSVESTIAVAGKNGLNKKDMGFSAAIATACPGLEGVTIGFAPAIGLSKAKPNVNMPFAIGTGDKAKAAAFTAAVAAGGDLASLTPVACGLKGFFKVDDKTSVAAEIDYALHKLDGKVGWKPIEVGASSSCFKAGVEFKASKAVTIKGKGTYEKHSFALDLAAKMALEGKSSFTIGASMSGDAPKVGFAYNLEA